MTKPTKWFFVFFIIIAIASGAYLYWGTKAGRSSVVLDGGPCRYDSIVLPAKVVSLIVESDSNVAVQVEITTRDSVVHSFYLNRVPPYLRIDKNELVKSGIKKGDLVKCTYYSIVEGGCTPHTFVLAWEKYRE
jgi:hypothetical protein